MAKVLGVWLVTLMAWALAATAAVAEGRWQALENNPSCKVWSANPDPSDTVRWSGACVDGKAQGSGTEVWRYLEDEEWKTENYTGEMKDGKKHGRGVWVAASGDRYKGDWKNGMQYGRGVLVAANGNRYEGDFREGKEHGRGVWLGPDGDRYEGDWMDGVPHGRGVFVFANGDVCEGDWRDGKLLGMGIAMLRSGQWRELWACWGLG